MRRLGTIARHAATLPCLNPKEQQVLGLIGDCGTGRLGHNISGCVDGHLEEHNNSCRDRHCPLCQGSARARWVQERLQELLPCPYFHVVFTIPMELRDLAYANKKLFYNSLFHAVHETLLDVGARPKNLGARLGGMSILHTWNQKLAFHPHIHCIIPGGGISPDGQSWVPGNPNFLLPVRCLSMVFRAKLLERLKALHAKNLLFAHNTLTINATLRKAASKEFVTYAKRPFGGPELVMKYLGRYTHRVGISEQRIVDYHDNTVSVAWLDRKHHHTKRIMKVSTQDFVKKFFLHILPKGLRKIRYFGYMANRDRGSSLVEARDLLIKKRPQVTRTTEPLAAKIVQDPFVRECKCCGKPSYPLCADRWRTIKGTLTGRLIMVRMRHGKLPGPEPNVVFG